MNVSMCSALVITITLVSMLLLKGAKQALKGSACLALRWEAMDNLTRKIIIRSVIAGAPRCLEIMESPSVEYFLFELMISRGKVNLCLLFPI